ncbi:MAG: hypothetical protein ACAI34_11410, partial [Verrucomicrobium sp.]|nr:hypothetical protein [Verrucomicrobium sp.]
MVTAWTRSTLMGILALAAGLATAEEPPYRRFPLEAPPEVILEAGGLAKLPGGKLAVATRRGEVWIAENPYAPEGKGVQWHLFANALHEPLGLAYHEGCLYTSQRS